jgi:hypothetical protein
MKKMKKMKFSLTARKNHYYYIDMSLDDVPPYDTRELALGYGSRFPINTCSD